MSEEEMTNVRKYGSVCCSSECSKKLKHNWKKYQKK